MNKEKYLKGLDLLKEFGRKLKEEEFTVEEAALIFLEGYNAAIRVSPKKIITYMED